MRVNLITNVTCRKGLYQDAVLVAGLLRELGHEPQIVNYIDSEPAGCMWSRRKQPRAELALMFEVVDPTFFGCSPRRWWIPNAEWTFECYLDHLNKFEHVLCKTRDCERLLRTRTDRAIYTGFMSRDQYQDAPRERAFFHACRGSTAKGTEALRGAWSLMGSGAPELVIAERLSPEALRAEQNRCRFHLCMSEYEGWGHCIHEGLSVGAVVVTTDAPPMSEVAGAAYWIPSVSSSPYNLAKLHKVEPEGVKQAVEWCLGLSDTDIESISAAARAAYETETSSFRAALADLVR